MTRRERWGLSWRGWLGLILVGALVGATWARYVHPFLAQTQRVDTRVLVVEGWVPLYVMRAAVAEFHAGHYDKIYTTGGPIVGSGGYSNDFNTYASVGADDLAKIGLPGRLVQMVPCHLNGRDRTYSSALALREYFRTNGIAVTGFNVLTEDAHARRSRMLFQDAFGPAAAVGVVSVPNPDYDPARWWRSSAGVREVLDESIAWFYAAFVFHPPKPLP
ncbi:MAG TPA: ElyC/SanA/YdcF family protein [Candidatus Acidoferrales bacterium]|nr:ElyC/SanA/YdcF family protein [Candidatus Acidoferrales bacterium]